MLLDRDDDLQEYYDVRESTIHGLGLYAREPLEEGEYLGTYQGPSVPDDGNHGDHVLWVLDEDSGEWSSRDGQNMLRYINHSTEPVAMFEGFDLFALRDIEPGEEITIDYGEHPCGEEQPLVDEVRIRA